MRFPAGKTIVNLIVAVVVVAALLAMIVVLTNRTDVEALRKQEMSNLTAIHSGLAVFAKQGDGFYPRPGRIETGPDGTPVPSKNTTANLYALLLARNTVQAEELISPRERNPKVTVFDPESGDPDLAYNPQVGRMWNHNFGADLETGSNVSYAHVPIVGKRAREQWRFWPGSDDVILGNRGPEDGRADPSSFATDGDGAWRGGIVYADGRVVWRDGMTLEGVFHVNDMGAQAPDNLFRVDSMEDDDAFLTFTIEAAPNPVWQFD